LAINQKAIGSTTHDLVPLEETCRKCSSQEILGEIESIRKMEYWTKSMSCGEYELVDVPISCTSIKKGAS